MVGPDARRLADARCRPARDRDRSRRDARGPRRRQRQLLLDRDRFPGAQRLQQSRGPRTRSRPAATCCAPASTSGRARARAARTPWISQGARHHAVGRLPHARATFRATFGVLSYSQSFVNPSVETSQDLLAFFVEDAVRVRPDVVLTAGLRWDYDSVTNTPHGDADLQQHRAARRRRLVARRRRRAPDARRAMALFYERIPFAVYSDTIFNNPAGGAISVTFAPGTAFPPPAFPAQLPRDAFTSVPTRPVAAAQRADLRSEPAEPAQPAAVARLRARGGGRPGARRWTTSTTRAAI